MNILTMQFSSSCFFQKLIILLIYIFFFEIGQIIDEVVDTNLDVFVLSFAYGNGDPERNFFIKQIIIRHTYTGSK